MSCLKVLSGVKRSAFIYVRCATSLVSRIGLFDFVANPMVA